MEDVRAVAKLLASGLACDDFEAMAEMLDKMAGRAEIAPLDGPTALRTAAAAFRIVAAQERKQAQTEHARTTNKENVS